MVGFAALVPWSRLRLPLSGSAGRPAKPTRLMVGLHYLKHVVYDLSDEEALARRVPCAFSTGAAERAGT